MRDFIKPFPLINQIRKKGMPLHIIHTIELLKEVNSVSFSLFFLIKEVALLKKKCRGIYPSGCCLKTNCPPKSRNTVCFSQFTGLWMTCCCCCCFVHTHDNVIFCVSDMYSSYSSNCIKELCQSDLHAYTGLL